MKLIDRIKAEVEKKTHGEQGYSSGDAECGYRDCARDILSFINTIEVKDVNLDEELDKWQQKHFEGIGYILDGSGGWIGRTSLLDIAEHFFELGLKTKGE